MILQNNNDMEESNMKTSVLKKFSVIFVIIGIMVETVGCGALNKKSLEDQTTVSTEDTMQTSSFSAKNAIKISDIDWHVTESIMDGQRFVSFNYTNNSKYTIMDIEMKFNQKEGTTAEQLGVFDNLKVEQQWTDEDVRNTYILGYNRKFADPGESVSDSPCVINGTYTLVESMAQYDIMQPDMATIIFIGDDEKGYEVYYDFKTQTYSESSHEAKNLRQWSDSTISSLLPKADYKAVQVGTDDEKEFCFDAYGVSREEFEAYVAAVKKCGFIEASAEDSDSYQATNADGVTADISYTAVEETMTGCVDSK